jgi:hypothetical protein
METSSHLFLHCHFFGSVWICILRWLGIISVMHSDVSSHFNHFGFLGGVAKSKQHILQAIWFATFGKYGKKEITGYLMIENAQFYRWWTKLSRHLSCG